MRVFRLLIGVAAAGWVAAPCQGQMAHMGQMMGGTRFMVNLVSPMTSRIQIGRGFLMISRGMAGMSGTGGMPMMTPGPGLQGLQIRMFLSGVADAGTPVTSNGSHLQISGTLTSTDGSNQAIDVDEFFDLTNGTGFVSVPFSLLKVGPPAVLEINKVGLVDASGTTFGVPGLRTSAPLGPPTPGAMPGMSPTPGMMGGGMGGHTTTLSHMGARASATSHMRPTGTMTPRLRPSWVMTPIGMRTMTPATGMRTMTPHMGPSSTMTPGMPMGAPMMPRVQAAMAGMGVRSTATPCMAAVPTMPPAMDNGMSAMMTPHPTPTPAGTL